MASYQQTWHRRQLAKPSFAGIMEKLKKGNKKSSVTLYKHPPMPKTRKVMINHSTHSPETPEESLHRGLVEKGMKRLDKKNLSHYTRKEAIKRSDEFFKGL
jgi:hypothetical protein